MHQNKSSLAILHHLRWLAALAVAVSHIRQNLLLDHSEVKHPGLIGDIIYFISAYGHAGVVLFFVLSGFLVGGKALSLLSSPAIEIEWKHFFVDRVSRIFVVLWPALAVSAVVVVGLHLFVPNAPFMTLPHWGWSMQHPVNQDFALKTWVGNAVLFNGLIVQNLRVNAPLWSLSYEWFYYMAALACVLVVRRVFSPGAIAIIFYAIILFGLGVLMNIDMIILSLVWIMGVAARAAFDRQILKGNILRYGALTLLLGLLCVDRFRDVPDLFLGLSVALVVANKDWAGWSYGGSWGAKLADFSYSLYLIHYPITIAVLGILFKLGMLQQRLPLSKLGVGIAFSTLVLVFVLARGFAFITEDQTSFWRKLLLKRLQIPSRKPASAIAAE